MSELVLKYAARDRPISVLDLGCGTGSLVFLLAAALPSARLVGIDVSDANIRSAQAHRVRLAGETAARIAFERADYLLRPASPADVLVSDGVLHLIPGETRALFAKL